MWGWTCSLSWASSQPPGLGGEAVAGNCSLVLLCLPVAHLFLPSLALSSVQDQHHHSAAFSALARVFAALWPSTSPARDQLEQFFFSSIIPKESHISVVSPGSWSWILLTVLSVGRWLALAALISDCEPRTGVWGVTTWQCGRGRAGPGLSVLGRACIDPSWLTATQQAEFRWRVTNLWQTLTTPGYLVIQHKYWPLLIRQHGTLHTSCSHTYTNITHSHYNHIIKYPRCIKHTSDPSENWVDYFLSFKSN